jgi:hypothetical protein
MSNNLESIKNSSSPRPYVKKTSDRFIPLRLLTMTDVSSAVAYDHFNPPTSHYQQALYKSCFENYTSSKTLKFNNLKTETPNPSHLNSYKVDNFDSSPEIILESQDYSTAPHSQSLAWSSDNFLGIILHSRSIHEPHVHIINLGKHSDREVIPLPDRNMPCPRSLEFLENNKLITAGADNRIHRIWDLTRLNIISSIGSYADSPTSLFSFNSRSQLMLAGASQGEIEGIDSRMKEIVFCIGTNHKFQTGLASSLRSSEFITGGLNGRLKLWDLRKETFKVREFNNEASVHAIRYCPSNSLQIATTGRSLESKVPQLKIYNINQPDPIASINTGTPVINLFWSQNGRKLVTFHESPTLGAQFKTWKFNPGDSKPLHLEKTFFYGGINSATGAMNPDGTTIVRAITLQNENEDQQVAFWKIFEKAQPKETHQRSSLRRERFYEIR